jgi:8-oxo-dGTP diphosphatase
MPNPVPIRVALDLVLITLGGHELHVALRRGKSGRWELPWAYVQADETLGVTAAKLARASIGSRPGWLQQVGALGTEKRHPAEAGLSVAYTGVVASGESRVEEAPSGNGSGMTWHALERLPALAPRHRLAVEEATTSIRTRFDLAPIAFHLLPERFTLSELQEVYELLLQRSIHKASFRRALHGARLVAPVAEFRSEGRGRPAQLFKFSPRKRTESRRGVRFDFGEV